MSARPRLRLEHAALVLGFLVVVGSVAAFDWRVAGLLLGLGLILSAIDLAGVTGGRR